MNNKFKKKFVISILAAMFFWNSMIGMKNIKTDINYRNIAIEQRFENDDFFNKNRQDFKSFQAIGDHIKYLNVASNASNTQLDFEWFKGKNYWSVAVV